MILFPLGFTRVDRQAPKVKPLLPSDVHLSPSRERVHIPPGDKIIFKKDKENHRLKSAFEMGDVSSQEGIFDPLVTW